ncbi:M48 family metalloprotease, partial [Candidatus Dependentiae bacterium]|nr:M48 family metalloprotease [Candidatus Dependentiae bacterium]
DIYIGKDLLDKLNEKELRAVIAHELGHIKNNHVIKRKVLFISQILLFFFKDVLANKFYYYSNIGSYHTDNEHVNFNQKKREFYNKFNITFEIFMFLFSLAENYISRLQEKEADLEALKYTKDPNLLISALEKIHQTQKEKSKVSYNILQFYSKYLWFLSSHPSLEKRADYLKKAAGGLA